MSESLGPLRISVITPTHNRPDSLLRLLRALRDGTFPASEFEAVIVADGCNDDTVLRARAEPLPFAVRVLEQNPGRGAAAARNLAATVATGELLVFLDDDIEPFPALLAEHWREYQRAKTPTAVVGPPRPVRLTNADLQAIAVWSWWEQQFAMMQRPGHRFTYDNLFSGNLSVPRALFSTVGGFDEEFNSCRDDSEFGLRVLRRGARIAFAPAAEAWHHELRDTVALRRRKEAEGIADVRLARLYPELWPVLNLAVPDRRRSRVYDAVRRAAFRSPKLGNAAAAALERALPLFEGLRMRGAWRTIQGGLMYYTYWQGVARAVGSYEAFTTLRGDCLERVVDAPQHEVDLAQGLESAEEALEAQQPAGVTIRVGSQYVGRIAHAGAEPLGARHLRVALAGELARPLKSALVAARAAGAPVLTDVDAPAVSVVIPAYNAAASLGATLDSVLAQTSSRWEAIVVDDGSTDGTADVAARYAARDDRIRLVRRPNGGEAAARNTGFAGARFDWVLFLDADDWLLPNALQSLARAARDDGTLDVITGGWSRVAADGTVLDAEYCNNTDDIFPVFARHNALPIHGAIVRRAALPLEPFDTSLKTCADWDFWQRLARAAVKFGRVQEVVAHYRMRVGSASAAIESLWPDGLRVIAQGHAADPRVANARHVQGAPSEQLPDARFEFACWVGGLLIGQDRDPLALLRDLDAERDPGLDPEMVALQLFQSVPLATARSPAAWDELWPKVSATIATFLAAVEQSSSAPLLARRAMCHLERLTLDASELPRPFTRGETCAVDVDVSQSMPTLDGANGVERAHCRVLADGARIGTVIVAIGANTATNREALADEIAQQYAWPILGWFLRGGPYQELAFVREPGGLTVTRERVTLATGLTDTEAIDAARLHDRIGWTVFLQELWERRHWASDEFYRDERLEGGSNLRHADKAHLTIDVGAELPSLSVAPGIDELALDVHVGGAPLGMVSIPVSGDAVGPAALRAAITLQASFALCRLAVREGVIGQPRAAGGPLHARLAARLAASGQNTPASRTFPALPNDAQAVSARPRSFDRPHVESVFAGRTDAWRYVTPYEDVEDEETPSLLTEGSIPRVRGRSPTDSLVLPVYILDIDVANRVEDVQCNGYKSARALIRRRGIPLGWVNLSCSEGRIAAADIVAAVRDQLGANARRAVVMDTLPVKSNSSLPPIRVVVCTRDRPDLLERCLQSLAKLDYPTYEVVVVDNASTSDLTHHVAEAASVRYVRESIPGLNWARNRGLATARHEIIAFTDDDCEVDPLWLRGIAAALDDASVQFVTGLVAPARMDTEAELVFELGYGGMGKGTLPRRWDPVLLSSRELIGAHHLGVGANMAFRRSLLTSLGGFDPGLDVGTAAHGAGDLDIFHRALMWGAVGTYEPRALVRHHHRRDMAALRRQHYDNGRAFGVFLLGILKRGEIPRRHTVWYTLRIWLAWLVRQLFNSGRQRDQLPGNLILAELRGAVHGPWAYFATRREAQQRAAQNYN